MRPKDITGQRFGRLVAIKKSGSKPRRDGKAARMYWLLQCDCGEKTIVSLDNLKNDRTLSCGCLHRFLVTTHGKTRSPEYRSWQSMIDRCFNPKMPRYSDWGGRGITVCKQWRNSFEIFLADMGPRPPGTSIDRIDNDGNYNPGNCRWATRSQQQKNRRPKHEKPS